MRFLRSPRPPLRTLATGSLAVATLMAGAALVGPAQADPSDEKVKVEKKIAQVEDHLDHTSKELRTAHEILTSTRAKLPAAQNALSAARAAQQAADLHNEEAVAALAVAKADEARAVADLGAARQAIADTRSRVASFAAQMYQEQGFGPLSVALEAHDPQELASRMAMADAVMDVQNGAISALSTTAAGLVAQESHLSALRGEVARAQRATEEALARASAAAGVAAAAKAELDALVLAQERAASDLETRRAQERAKLRDLEGESARLTAVLKEIARKEEAARLEAERKKKEREERENKDDATPDPPPANDPPPSGGYLSAPSAGWISSEFGWRWHPILNYARLHSGRDYAASCGSPVRAAAPGTIVSAGWGGGYGNQIVVSHGQQGGISLSTTYNHLSGFAVRGGAVARGQVIGQVGTTGLSTGCHLHFETREAGVPVDPRGWL